MYPQHVRLMVVTFIAYRNCINWMPCPWEISTGTGAIPGTVLEFPFEHFKYSCRVFLFLFFMLRRVPVRVSSGDGVLRESPSGSLAYDECFYEYLDVTAVYVHFRFSRALPAKHCSFSLSANVRLGWTSWCTATFRLSW